MARIERAWHVDSTLISKKFLIKLLKIINELNPKSIGVKTEITIYSEQETSVYENLRDFIESKTIPREILKFSIKKSPYNKREKEKVIQFFLNMESDPKKSYYQLVGYDDGKLSAAEKRLELLFDEYKNWYNPIFRFSSIHEGLKIGVGISFGILAYKVLKLTSISSDISGLAAFIIFIVGYNYVGKWLNTLFPFQDFQMRTPKRLVFWRNAFIVIVLGLMVNLIWNVVVWLINNVKT